MSTETLATVLSVLLFAWIAVEVSTAARAVRAMKRDSDEACARIEAETKAEIEAEKIAHAERIKQIIDAKGRA